MTVALVVSAIVGLLTAVIELYGRYRTFPMQAIFCLPGLAYVLLNMTASIAAFMLAGQMGWSFGASAPVADGVLAGLGGMAILRSNVFLFQQGETQVDIGPSALLAGLRTVIDRDLDQRHARSVLRADPLKGMEFTKQHEALTLLCQTALVNPDPKLAVELGDLAAQLKSNTAYSEQYKMKVFSMALVSTMGRGAVEEARRALATLEAPEVVPDTTALSSTEAGRQSRPNAGDLAQGALHRDEMLRIRNLIDAIEANPDTGNHEFLIDLYLRRACLAYWVAPEVAPWAFSEVPFDDASRLFGGETVFSASTPHVAHRLLPLLDWNRTSSAHIRTQSSLQEPIIERRPDWLVAAALTELSQRLIADPDVQLPILDAAITLAPDWDVYVLRAACNLRRGDQAAALTDLRAAGRQGPELQPVAAVGRDRWEILLGPVTALVGGDLPQEAHRALWNSATVALANMDPLWMRQGNQQSPIQTTRHGVPPTDRDAEDLKDLLTKVAERIPARRPAVHLTRADFCSPSSGTGGRPPMLANDIMVLLGERYGIAPTQPDAITPPTRTLEERLPLEW